MDVLAIDLVQYNSPASLKIRHRRNTKNEKNNFLTQQHQKGVSSNHLNNPLDLDPINGHLEEHSSKKSSKSIDKRKKKYIKTGNIPKSMKKFCKENHVSRIAAKQLLKASDVQDLLYFKAKEEKKGVEEEMSLLSDEVLPPPTADSVNEEIIKEENIENSIVARRDSLGEILQEDNITLDNDTNPGVYENIQLDDIMDDTNNVKQIESMVVVEETLEKISLNDKKSIAKKNNDSNSVKNNYDKSDDNFNAGDDNLLLPDDDNYNHDDLLVGQEIEDDGDIELMKIPSVNDLFDQIMNDLQLSETLDVIEESAVVLENQPPIIQETSFALREDELATTTLKGEELKVSDMSDFDSSTIEGMSVYVENIAENMLEMLESNAREVMKYEGEVISEIGDIQYVRPWWAENDVHNKESGNDGTDSTSMAVVSVENGGDDVPVTLNLVCEKLKLATTRFQGSRVQNNKNIKEGNNNMATTKRFDNIMAITRRATEDFCLGVRTEFRRLVDEITESRAFIQRLEKMLGEEIEQKVNLGVEKSEELKEAERQLRLMEQRERSRMMTLASMKRALKDQMQDVRVMLDQRTSNSVNVAMDKNVTIEDVS
eukprot:g9858.t1